MMHSFELIRLLKGAWSLWRKCELISHLIFTYEEANEDNEMQFSQDVDQLISQIEIYDQIWYARHMPEDHEQQHSEEAVALVREFVEVLESIPDGCAETFPFETIEELTREYLNVE